ncbi:MAG: sterol desaturase family protein [Rhodobiaceae bacterium]|nr:sterol desaturase family protein [Rhodobiaceae bacterium]
MSSADIYAVGVPIIVVLILAEVGFSAWRRLSYYQLADFGGTLGLLTGNILISGVSKGAVLGLSFYLYQFRLLDIAETLPLWLQWFVAFFAIDFTFYCYHRASHRVRALWAVHMNHHCSEEMNFSVAFRQAWFGPISKVPFFIALPLIGFDPSITVVVGVIATLWGVVGHTRCVGKLPAVFEFIFNTPSAHRVHHGSNPAYIDKNYGNLFMLWDRLFGTYAEEQEEVVYGLVNNVKTNNPITLTFYVWREIIADMSASSSVRELWLSLFGPPEWQPTSEKTKS